MQVIDDVAVVRKKAVRFDTLAAASRRIGAGSMADSTEVPAWWDVAFFETNLDFPMNQSTLRFPHFTQGRDERERAS